MKFNLLEGPMLPAEGESVVRTYHATSLSSGLLRLKAEGHVTITNRRVVFYASGTSFNNKSIFESEVPIADISGISSYKGTYVSTSHLVIAILACFIGSFLITAIIALLASSLIRASQNLSLTIITPLLVSILLLIVSLWSKTNSIWKSILAAAATTQLISLSLGGLALSSLISAASILSSTASSYTDLAGNISFLLTIFALICFIYSCVCCLLYARRETMSLAIGSKGGSSTPIAITGISGFGLFGGAALRAVTAAPAADVEVMIKELGAAITDIQNMGDLGVDKWQLK